MTATDAWSKVYTQSPENVGLYPPPGLLPPRITIADKLPPYLTLTLTKGTDVRDSGFPLTCSSSRACSGLHRGCLHELPPRTAVLGTSPGSEHTNIRKLEI